MLLKKIFELLKKTAQRRQLIGFSMKKSCNLAFFRLEASEENIIKCCSSLLEVFHKLICNKFLGNSRKTLMLWLIGFCPRTDIYTAVVFVKILKRGIVISRTNSIDNNNVKFLIRAFAKRFVWGQFYINWFPNNRKINQIWDVMILLEMFTKKVKRISSLTIVILHQLFMTILNSRNHEQRQKIIVNCAL